MEEGFDTFCVDASEQDEVTRVWRTLTPAVLAWPHTRRRRLTPVGSCAGFVRAAHGRAPPRLVRLTPEDHRYLTSFYDDSVPLPPGAGAELSERNPRLRELREAYAALDLPVTVASRWNRSAVQSFLDLRWFRGETLITWHYRELPRITALKYFVLLRYVAERDTLGLLERLEEDGAFGCWTSTTRPRAREPRPDRVGERDRLPRAHARLSVRERFSVLDIGAGYGRLAHRMSAGLPAARRLLLRGRHPDRPS